MTMTTNTISNVNINNQAAPVSREMVSAMTALARAAEELAVSIGKIADSMKGSSAHMGTGIVFNAAPIAPTPSFNEEEIEADDEAGIA